MNYKFYIIIRISIHAPAQGATFSQASAESVSSDFNSRSRTGSDAAGADRLRCPHGFQFTLPHRERPVKSNATPSMKKFQFTLPHRERLQAEDVSFCGGKFQFTLPHRERRICIRGGETVRDISIHAPAQGATVAGGIGALAAKDFNSRSRTGSDYYTRDCKADSRISIHAPAQGATVVCCHGHNVRR